MLRRFSVTSRPAIDSSLYKNDLPISPTSAPAKACLARDDKASILPNLAAYVESRAWSFSFPTDGTSWIILSPIEQSIRAKIEKYGIPLRELNISINYGIKTGLNEAFIIDGATKNRLITEDPKSAEIIRPILRGKDINRYGYSFQDRWLIVAHNGYDGYPFVDITSYPAIKKWLDSWEPRLSNRCDKGRTPYNLRDCAYMSLFSQPKILWAETMRVHKGSAAEDFPRFGYTESPLYTDKTCFIATGEELLLSLAVLNSTIGHYQLLNTVSILDNGGFLMQKIYIDKIRIPVNLPTTLIDMVKQQLKSPHQETQCRINNEIYAAFGITAEEAEFIENRIAYRCARG